ELLEPQFFEEKSLDQSGKVVERVGVLARRRLAAVAESEVIGRDNPESAGELRNEIAEHVGRGRETMQQNDNGGIGRPRFPIENPPVELLPDGAALARWLEAAGLIDRREAGRLMRRWAAPEFGKAAEGLREFRESLRKIVFQMEAGDPVAESFIRDLNARLRR